MPEAAATQGNVKRCLVCGLQFAKPKRTSATRWIERKSCSPRCAWTLRSQVKHGSDIERFMSKVAPEPNCGCWLWTGSLFHTGYARFSIAGKPHFIAHRYAYEAFCHPIPDGLNVLHKCDVRCCVNPAHLFLGTHSDNMKDMASKKRHFVVRLRPAEVIEMRARYEAGESIPSLATAFDTPYQTAYYAVTRRTWTHV